MNSSPAARCFIASGLVLAGVMIFGVGLAYGAVTVGVPYQDPTPAQYAAEQINVAISAWAMGVGLCVFTLGLVMLFVLAALKLIRRRACVA
jgi:hypothetical protein